VSTSAGTAAVVDASSVAALIFGEPDSESIARQLAGRVLTAPSLLAYEIANVCLKKVRNDPDHRDEIRALHRLFSRMEIHSVDVPFEEALDLAERLELSVYDAAYLWLARALGCELVTLDRTLAAAFNG
jgi:predicted nucleic acid-binding protein